MHLKIRKIIKRRQKLRSDLIVVNTLSEKRMILVNTLAKTYVLIHRDHAEEISDNLAIFSNLTKGELMLFKGKKKEADKKPDSKPKEAKEVNKHAKATGQNKSGLLGLCKGIVVKKDTFSDDFDYS